MSNQTRSRWPGGTLALVGLSVAVAALLADTLDFGDASGTGWQHRLVVLGGLLVAAIGAALVLRLRLPRPAASREVLGRLALAGGSLLFSLLLAEAGLRLVRPPSVALDHQPLIYQPDPILGYRYIPNSRGRIERLEFRQPVRVNGAGFLDDEFAPAPAPNVTRIAALGDSFTAGMHVGRGRNYPDVLERLLNESGWSACPCEVLNFGIDGTGTVQQAALFEEVVLDYQPDIVIVAYFGLDVFDVAFGTIQRDLYRNYVIYYRDEAERAEMARQVDEVLSGGGATLRFGLRHSYILRALYNTRLERRGNPSPNLRANKARPAGFSAIMPLEEAETQVIESVTRIQAACQEAGCELVFVASPSKEEVAAQDEPLYLPVLEAVSGQGVRTVSLLQPFQAHAARGERLFWQYDGHYNEAGYRLMAEEIATYLTASNPQD